MVIYSVKVLFTYDKKFYKAFNKKGGKPANAYMNQIIALVRNAFRDKTLKNAIGTRVYISASKKRYRNKLKDNK